jgi:hypothetical protein
VSLARGRRVLRPRRLGKADADSVAFLSRQDAVRWNEASSVIPRLVPLMAYPPYRRSLLEGLSLSIGSLSEGTVRLALLSPSSLLLLANG